MHDYYCLFMMVNCVVYCGRQTCAKMNKKKGGMKSVDEKRKEQSKTDCVPLRIKNFKKQ